MAAVRGSAAVVAKGSQPAGPGTPEQTIHSFVFDLIVRSWGIKLLAFALHLFAWGPRPVLAKDAVRIVSLSPQTSKPLRAGDIVTIEIGVQIDSDSSASMRSLWVEFYGGRLRDTEFLAWWKEVVPNGRIIRTFRNTFRVPATSKVSVQAAISQGTLASMGKRPISADTKDYSVVDPSGKKINPPSVDNDKVTITSISPVPGSLVRIGDTITFDLKADYELQSAGTGRVVWELASTNDVEVILSSTPIQRGKGTLSLSRTVQIPPGLGAEPVAAIVFLLPADLVRGTAFDRKNFRLEQSAEGVPNALSQIAVDVTGGFEDYLKIASISPSPQNPLRGGETVDFEVNLEYRLGSVDAAELIVTFGTFATFAEVHIPTYARDSRIVEKGRRSLAVTRRLWIPTELNGNFPVAVRLSPPAHATDKVTYNITP